MRYPKSLVPKTAAMPLANKNVDMESAGTLVKTANTVEK